MTPLWWIPTLRLAAPHLGAAADFQGLHGDYGYVVVEDPAVSRGANAPLCGDSPVTLYDYRRSAPSSLPDTLGPKEIWVSLPRGLNGSWPIIAQFFSRDGQEDRLVWFATHPDTLDDRLLTLWQRLDQVWREAYPPLWLDFLSFGEAWCAYAAALYPWVQIANVPDAALARLEQIAKDTGRPLYKRSRLMSAPDLPLSLPLWAPPTA